MPLLVLNVPEAFVTVTSTVPTPPGDVAVMVSPFDPTFAFVAGVVPKSTVEPCVNPEPTMVTVVPPFAGPDAGESELITG